jgi:P27 family predicted phage terminase small subunit
VRGRKPLPENVRQLRGNPGNAKPINEPKPQPKTPTCPSWLPSEAKNEWKRVTAELDRIGMLTLVDRGALATYCEAWALLKQAEEEIARYGMVIYTLDRELRDEDGNVVQLLATAKTNPAVRVAHSSMQYVRAFAAEFGLTPSSRSRINLPKPTDDDLKELLGGRPAFEASP